MSDQPDAYDLLKSAIHLCTSSIPFDAKLNQMLKIISEASQSDQCLFLEPEKIAKNGFLSHVASGKKPLWLDEGSSSQHEGILPEEEHLLCPTFACIPVFDELSFQGILYLGFSKKRKFSSQEVDLLLLISKEMGLAIRNAHLHQRTEKSISELIALQEMGKVIASTLKLEELFKLIVETGIRILKAKGGVLRVEDPRTGELKVRFSMGDYHQNPLDEKIAKRVFHTRTPLSLNHFREENPFHSIVCTPFLSKGKSFGTLAFYDKETEPSDMDFQLLLAMATLISSSIENALAHHETSSMARKHEKMVGQLSTLWELSKALLTTMNLDLIVRMTLTAITIGEGLGFNRAMLFLINEKTHALEGTMAVGPDSAEEAGRIWATLSQKGGHPLDLVAQLSLAPHHESALNSIVKGIQIPLQHQQCILSRTVFEGRPFNVPIPQGGWHQTRCERGCQLESELGCLVGEHLSRDPRVCSFAVVPLWGKGKVIGIILVDNLYNQTPITEEDIHFLSMFSNQAGLAIENATLYRNLEEVHQELKETQTLLVQREKMAALGELSSTVAHQIKNPLVSIGGFARRLYRSIPAETPEKRYTQTIIIEVARLERILSDILDYTSAEAMALKECDLREVLEDSLSMISEGFNGKEIQLVKEFDEKIPRVIGDHQQLKQVFYNLITNARQAMKGGGTLSIRVYPFVKNGSSCVKVEVKDTGKGIDPENLHHIFNPFYTTKESSSGLGLPIVYKIVISHRGQIEVDNQPGKGVTFIITLPVAQAGNVGG